MSSKKIDILKIVVQGIKKIILFKKFFLSFKNILFIFIFCFKFY